MLISLLQRAWHSPTFTSWTNRAAQSVRLIVLLPLILRDFDDVQIACWFLFSSTLFFAQMISRQISLVMARMIAMANGGASDLSPHTGKIRHTLGAPNWPLIERLYGTLQSLSSLLSVLGLIMIAAIGYYSLKPLLSNYAAASEVWWAFAIFAGGAFINDLLRKYEATLKGLNQVALTNRWGALSSVLSSCSGALVLILGGSIVALSITMQAFLLIGLLLQWTLLNVLVEPRFRSFKKLAWDKQILQWAWQPLYRGTIQALSTGSGPKISSIVLARHLESNPVALASILLVLRLFDMLTEISITPLASHTPRLARLIGEGKIASFRNGVEHAFRLSSFVHVAGIIAIACFGGIGLKLIGSETGLPSPLVLFAIGTIQTLFFLTRISMMISLIGNNAIVVGRLLLCTLITAGLAFWLIPIYPFWGVIISSYLPVVLIVNIKPLRIGCTIMQESATRFAARTMAVPLAVLLLAAAVTALVVSQFN